MSREDVLAYIAETYHTDPEYPWVRYPEYAVFRHESNRKWFAVILEVPRDKLGLAGSQPLTIVNVKCDPRLMGSFLREPGIFPGYHMNKGSWLSVALDGSAGWESLQLLLEVSYDLTGPRKKSDKAKTTKENP